MSLRFRLLVASLFACTAISCVTSKINPLPAYDSCVAVPPAAEPRCVWANEIDVKTLPTMVPYAHASKTSNDKAAAGDALRRTCESVKPDLIILNESGSYYGGTFTKSPRLLGAGSSSSDRYRQSYSATCYRRAPVDIGLSWDELGMIVQAEDSARASGIRAGDQIVSIAGVPVEYGEQNLTSPHWAQVLTLKPGDRVELAWTRPGVGRMQGTMICSNNG